MATKKRTSVSALIRDRRRGMDITQAELGERIGCHQATVAGWESPDAKAQDALIRAARLFTVLKIDPADIS